MNKSKGITLIALVVTIVVLLILAAVSISMLTGESGIITQAQKSRKETLKSNYREEINLIALGEEMKYQTDQITFEQMVSNAKTLIEQKEYVITVTRDDSMSPDVILKAQTDINFIVSVKFTEDGIEISDETGEGTEQPEESSDLKWIYHENEDGDIEITGIDLSEYEYTEGIGPDWYYKFIALNIETCVVPSKLDGKDVVKFEWKDSIFPFGDEDKWGVDFTDVKKIVYPDTIEEICNTSDGWDITFSSVEEIHLPSNLKILGDCALTGCSSLQNIKIPDSVISIGYAAFRGCSSLQSITIPDGVTSIGSESFKGCSSLININIPENVTEIGKWAYLHCNNLSSVTIPSTVSNIGDEAFEKNEGAELTLYFLDGTNNNLTIPSDKWGADKIIISGVEYNP